MKTISLEDYFAQNGAKGGRKSWRNDRPGRLRQLAKARKIRLKKLRAKKVENSR